MIALGFSVFLSALDLTAVSTALPTIAYAICAPAIIVTLVEPLLFDPGMNSIWPTTYGLEAPMPWLRPSAFLSMAVWPTSSVVAPSLPVPSSSLPSALLSAVLLKIKP